ncbi:MAG: hypothetical protein KAS04_04630 [Candidatus Aenigmarchaeota archaeon]|nr:hypothetical protein [Candidatus Aenigmarchaeota archaeon]
MTTQEYQIGDAYKLMQQFPDNYFDLILTDPPYGIDESNEKNATRDKICKTTDFGTYDWDKERLLKSYFDEMLRVSKNQIIFGGNYYTDYLPPTPCWIIWDKDNSGNFADVEIAYTSFKTASRLFKYRWNGMLQGDMKHKEKRVHPTQKPLPLFTWILEKYSKPGYSILDPFCGSGTTLEACKNLNLDCLCIDKSDQWIPYYKQRLNPNKYKVTNGKLTEYDSLMRHFK